MSRDMRSLRAIDKCWKHFQAIEMRTDLPRLIHDTFFNTPYDFGTIYACRSVQQSRFSSRWKRVAICKKLIIQVHLRPLTSCWHTKCEASFSSSNKPRGQRGHTFSTHYGIESTFVLHRSEIEFVILFHMQKIGMQRWGNYTKKNCYSPVYRAKSRQQRAK